jgi:DNA repair protein RecO
MKEERTEGVVLKAVLHKDQERIITIFTHDHGLMSLIVKRIQGRMMLTTPLCRAEFIYTKGRSDLYRLQDGSVIDSFLELRNHLHHLQAAGELAQAILHSQLPGKSSPKLYALLCAYLKNISLFPDPLPLTLSFRLKLLSHDGLLHWDDLSAEMRTLGQARSFHHLSTLRPTATTRLHIEQKFKFLISDRL